MKPKTVVSAVLLAFVAASALYLAVGQAGRSPAAVGESAATAGEPAADAASADRAPARVVAYYFHGTRRCPTCLAIEKTARESLQRELADAFESGAIEWRTVDFEEAGNEHFAQEFALTGASLILVKQADGRVERWGNLERVWDLVGDDAEVSAYVTAEARGYLEES